LARKYISMFTHKNHLANKNKDLVFALTCLQFL
jgi:hypothetical protein